MAYPVIDTYTLFTASPTNDLIARAPSGMVTGDLWVVFFNYYDTVGGTDPTEDQFPAPPSGWTALDDYISGDRPGFGNYIASKGFWRIAAGNAPSDVNFGTLGGGCDFVKAHCFRISGHDPTTPIAAADSSAQYTDNKAYFPALVSTRAENLRVGAIFGDFLGDHTDPAGWTVVTHTDADTCAWYIQHASAGTAAAVDFATGGSIRPRNTINFLVQPPVARRRYFACT